jgi:hypothetical protein
MVSQRERTYLRRLSAASRAPDETSDLFREVEVSARRKHHLILVILRKAHQLGAETPANLEAMEETDLHAIRFSLSKRIAREKMAAPDEEIAA